MKYKKQIWPWIENPKKGLVISCIFIFIFFLLTIIGICSKTLLVIVGGLLFMLTAFHWFGLCCYKLRKENTK